MPLMSDFRQFYTKTATFEKIIKRSKEARGKSYLWNYYKNTYSSDIPRKLTD